MQFDTYREMRDVATDAWAQPPCAATPDMRWQSFTPGTNALWVAHLCDVLRLKRFKGLAMSAAERKALLAFRCGTRMTISQSNLLQQPMQRPDHVVSA